MITVPKKRKPESQGLEARVRGQRSSATLGLPAEVLLLDTAFVPGDFHCSSTEKSCYK